MYNSYIYIYIAYNNERPAGRAPGSAVQRRIISSYIYIYIHIHTYIRLHIIYIYIYTHMYVSIYNIIV